MFTRVLYLIRMLTGFTFENEEFFLKFDKLTHSKQLIDFLNEQPEGYFKFHFFYNEQIKNILASAFCLLWLFFIFCVVTNRKEYIKSEFRSAMFITFVYWCVSTGISLMFTNLHLLMLVGLLILL